MQSSLLEQIVAEHAPLIQRIDVAQFHGMRQLGLLREGQAVELIDGLLIRKDRSDRGGDPRTHGPRHALAIKRLQRLAPRFASAGCHLQCQLPLTLSEILEPEPDAALVRGAPEDYPDRHPGPADTWLVIEVADRSLSYDRSMKGRIYATAGIGVYWILNLPDRRLEVYTAPLADEGRYAQRRDFPAADAVRIELPGETPLELPVADLVV